MRKVVILRPEPGAGQTLARARELGLDATALPLFEVRPIEWAVPDIRRFDALLVTSANAVRHAEHQLEQLRGLRAYAVGEATAAGLRSAGFDLAGVGPGGVERLLSSLEPDLRLLHLCGEHRHSPAGASQAITALPVYRSEAIAAPCALEQLNGGVAVVHSARAGQRLAELAPARERTRVAAISAQVAQACGTGWERIVAADVPTDEALLSLAEWLCQDSNPG
jgi:uroporphyrinogen-III synthase